METVNMWLVCFPCALYICIQELNNRSATVQPSSPTDTVPAAMAAESSATGAAKPVGSEFLRLALCMSLCCLGKPIIFSLLLYSPPRASQTLLQTISSLCQYLQREVRGKLFTCKTNQMINIIGGGIQA